MVPGIAVWCRPGKALWKLFALGRGRRHLVALAVVCLAPEELGVGRIWRSFLLAAFGAASFFYVLASRTNPTAKKNSLTLETSSPVFSAAAHRAPEFAGHHASFGKKALKPPIVLHNKNFANQRSDMLSKETLSRRTEEATLRIEQERIMEEERQRREVDTRRLEEEQTRQLEAHRQQWRREAKRRAAALFHEAVKAANRGEREVSVGVTLEVSEFLENELRNAGFTFVKSRISDLQIDIESRLHRLFAKLDDSPRAQSYQERLLDALGEAQRTTFPLNPKEAVLEVLVELEGEGEDVLSESASDCLQSSLRAIRDNSTEYEPLHRYRLQWEAVDLTQTQFSMPGHVPSWLLSRSGSWVMQRVGECAAKNADAGQHQACFDLVSLAGDTERWGANTMTKLVHDGQPIGVTPFTAGLMLVIFKTLGFEAELVKAGEAVSLKVSW